MPLLETHPFPPYLPQGAKVLIMGTFPPQPKRWAMEFYYPNRTNDFWRIIGLLIYGDRDALYNPTTRQFRLELIKETLDRTGIALHDTGREVERLKDNASDKFLNIVTPVPLWDILAQIPECHTIATTGEKAAQVIADLTGTEPPRMGHYTDDAAHGLKLWRMPSTSRAYPLALEKKAEYYAMLLRDAGIIK
ncbi:MAG: uracil-DNA glycosylase family protein [Duncaniella sp.]|nr:uracil-DNA glycosylase family protein [Duncaniella sp.]